SPVRSYRASRTSRSPSPRPRTSRTRSPPGRRPPPRAQLQRALPPRSRRRRVLSAAQQATASLPSMGRALASITVAVCGAPAPAPAPAPPTAGIDVSSNWSGYAVTGVGSTATVASTSMSFMDVTGTWTQPAATCTPGQSTSAAIWVGLGGYTVGSNALEQTGTSADCNSAGKATYYAWYELVPATSVTLKLKVFPGDKITATVLVKGTDVLVQVKNRTRHTSFTKHLQMEDPDMTSAEWIAEAPSECTATGLCRTVPLTNFGSVTFSKIAALGNGHGGTLSGPGRE